MTVESDDIESFFDHRFTAKWDLGDQDVVVQITHVERGELIRRSKTGEETRKAPFLHVRSRTEQLKPIPLNKINKTTIVNMYGSKVSAWKGKLITIYHDANVRFGREVVGGIRIRPTPPKANQASPKPEPAANALEQKQQLKSAIEKEREPGSD